MLFDGNAIVHRAYHAFQTSNRPIVLTVPRTGEVVTAVFGFAQMLLKVINDQKATCYAVAFDTKAPTFRHKMVDTYKAQRPPTPPELIDQFGRVKQLVEAFNIPIYELDGFEADDVIGALSKQASEQGIDTMIVTGDADSMQLVSPTVTVLSPKKSFSDTMIYDEAAVEERFHVKPKQVADYKALVGDASDNIKGVRGIGEKTAVKLLQQFGSIEGIYTNLDKVAPPRIQIILREQEAVARQCKVMTTIDVNAPVTLDLNACHVSNYDRTKVTELFRELEFSSLLAKLPEMAGAEPEAVVKVETAPLPECTYCTVNTAELLDKLIARLSSARSFAFDTETTGLDPMTARLVGISLSPASGESYYIPVGHLGFMGIAQQLPMESVMERLKPILADPALVKFAHNANYDMTVLANHGAPVVNLTIDTMVAAHLLSENSLGLKALAFSRLGIEMLPITDLIGTGAKQLNMSQVEIDKAAAYACADADMTWRLAELLAPELRDSELLWKLFADVEMPLVPVLVDMERNGIALNTGLLRQMSQEFGEQLRKLEAEIYNSVGHQFNINSPQQLGLILFEELNLPTNQKKKGSYSTSANVLEDLKGTHPVIQAILDYRTFTKLKSTYIDALPGLLNSRTGRLHTSFNQTRTATGRLSSSDPNLQNIPVRGELGKQVRQAFIAPSGSLLLSGDYSQIDLRALAHLSQDPALVQAFEHDEDIHSATASRLYGVEASKITPDMRRFAKTINFGVIYGMSGYGLEQATELSREEANKFITAYFEKYPGITKYLEATRQQARDTGYVQTLLGRRRSIPEINSPNRQMREAAERMAINMPVQGTSADIIKVAMVKLFKVMNERRLKSKMLLQVHDELLFEVPEDELEEMRRLVPDIMSNAIKLSIPVKVDIKVGPNWADMK